MTNFERITESPEELSSFIAEISYFAGCDGCPENSSCCSLGKCSKAWLDENTGRKLSCCKKCNI